MEANKIKSAKDTNDGYVIVKYKDGNKDKLPLKDREQIVAIMLEQTKISRDPDTIERENMDNDMFFEGHLGAANVFSFFFVLTGLVEVRSIFDSPAIKVWLSATAIADIGVFIYWLKNKKIDWYMQMYQQIEKQKQNYTLTSIPENELDSLDIITLKDYSIFKIWHILKAFESSANNDRDVYYRSLGNGE